MTAVSLIREIETAAYRCWPAKEIEEHDGWQLRFSDGFSRRANSVYPANRSRAELWEKLGWCRDWYAQRGLDLVIRQNPATEPGLDVVLQELEFLEEGRTNVMIMDVDSGFTRDANVADQPSATWWHAMAGMWGIDEDRRDAWRDIVNRISLPVGYAIAMVGEDAVAAGFGVVDGEWLGLFEVIVDTKNRRRGMGSDLTASLMGWGRERGAGRAFLQVVADNIPAIEMYEHLGFRSLYGYWYRRAPQTFYE